MPVGGAGAIIYLADESENAARVSEAGRAFFSESYSRIKTHSPVNVTAASGGSTFETVAVGRVILRSESGNSIMWIGGTGDDAPYSGKGYPIFGGQETEPLPVTNFNAVRVCAAVSGQLVYAIGFLNGPDLTLSNEAPIPPPPPPTPEAIPPIVISHSPVSGLSGVAQNSELSVVFNEVIASGSVTSGSFHLSPAHNVTIYRDVTDTSKIVMTPNVNMSGSTNYVAGVNYQITDLVGNPVSGTSGNSWVFTWPFRTFATPPGADVTPPVVSGTTPVSGASGVSAGTDVTILFSEAMTSDTINAQNIYLSYLSGVVPTSGISGIVSLGVDEKTVTLNPTPALLSGGTVIHINVLSGVTDIADIPNPMAEHDRSRVFTTSTYDSTPPTISSVNPVSGATNVGTDTDVIVVFSEAMLSGTINAQSLYLSYASGAVATSGISGVVSLSGNQTTAAISPVADLSGSTVIHVNILNSVTDLAGNALVTSDRSRVFTTETLDTTRPTVVSVFPANGAANRALNTTARVTFSEAMLSGTINVNTLYLSKTSGGTKNPAAGGYTVTLSGNQLCAEINPTANLDAGYTYYIQVTSGVKDLADNNMLNHNFGNSFTTIYNFTEQYNVTSDGGAEAVSASYNTRVGSQAHETYTSFLGVVMKKITFRLYKVGNPTGTGYCRIRNSAGTIVATMGTIDVSTLDEYSSIDVNFTNMDNSHAIDLDDHILFEFTGGNSSNYVVIETYSGGNAFSGTRLAWYSGSWSYDGGQEVAGIFWS